MKLPHKTIKHYKQTDRPFKKVIIFHDTQTDTQTLHHNIFITITIPGGYELTDTDVLKLQRMYGCNGACGGYAKSEGGGFSSNKIRVSIFSIFFVCIITGKLEGKNSDRESPCEWILETSPGKVEKENTIWINLHFTLKKTKNILNTFQGIEIAISELTGPTDCSTDYLEVEQNFQLLVIFSPSNTHTPTHLDWHTQTLTKSLTHT